MRGDMDNIMGTMLWGYGNTQFFFFTRWVEGAFGSFRLATLAVAICSVTLFLFAFFRILTSTFCILKSTICFLCRFLLRSFGVVVRSTRVVILTAFS